MYRHFSVKSFLDHKCKTTHYIFSAAFYYAECKYFGIFKKIPVVLYHIKSKFIDFKRSVGYSFYKRMLQIAVPKFFNRIKQSVCKFHCYISSHALPYISVICAIFSASLSVAAPFFILHFQFPSATPGTLVLASFPSSR